MRRVRVLVVDDYEPFRRFASSTMEKRHDMQIIGEVSDGLEAVKKVEELRPDLILLDIGLPTLDGLEVARRIRVLSPKSQILFVSQESSAEIVQEAFNSGAMAYVVKTDAGSELLVAIDAALRGEKFVGRRFASHGVTAIDARALEDGKRHDLDIPARRVALKTAGRHEVGFYSDDRQLLDHLTQFIGDALKVGNAAVVVATESHRSTLLLTLRAYGVDIVEAIEQGRYITANAADTISTFIVNEMLDTGRFMSAVSNLIVTAVKAAKHAHPRVAFFGEGTNLLLKQGYAQAVIQDEKLCNELITMYDVDILCGFSAESATAGLDDHIFHLICSEHTAVHSW